MGGPGVSFGPTGSETGNLSLCEMASTDCLRPLAKTKVKESFEKINYFYSIFWQIYYFKIKQTKRHNV